MIAAGFERIHRTNLIAMGILPIQCSGLHEVDADEFDILGLDPARILNGAVTVVARRDGVDIHTTTARTRIDTETEREWLCAGGVIPRILTSR